MQYPALIREAAPATWGERARQAAGWGYRWGKVARRTYRQWRDLEGIPLDRAFDSVEKLHRTEPRTVPTPEVRGVPFMAEASHHKRRATYTTPEDYVAVLRDVLYCPATNLLLSEDRKVISESLATEMLDDEPLREVDVEYLPGCYTPLRSLHNVHYHILVDNLPRLLALDRPPFSNMENVKALCPGGPNAVEEYLFSKMAPDNAVIVSPPEDRLYRLEKVLFTPFKSRRYAPYLPPEYVERFREKVLPERPSNHDRRLFISRTDRHRRVANREELMAALAERGFEKIVAENYPPEEEVELFYDAEVIMGAHGSGLTNILFAKEAKTVELSPFWYLSPHYYYLSKSLGHAFGVWSGPGYRWMPTTFTVDVPGVLRLLDRMDIR